MDDERAWQVIEQERLHLAALLETLTPLEWQHPSLCAGWSVRDVAAHLTLISEPPPWTTFLAEGVGARGNPHRLNTAMSKLRARRPTDDLVAALRATAASRRLPVVTDRRNVLFDLLVHMQDVAVPLGREVAMPPDAATAAAARVWAMGWPFQARRRLRGLTLSALDADWSVGQGPRVEGPIAALLLLLTGRPAALPALSGPGVERLRRGAGLPGPARTTPQEETP